MSENIIDPKYQEDLTEYTTNFIERYKQQFTKRECDMIIKECQGVCKDYTKMTQNMTNKKPKSITDDIQCMVSPKLNKSMDPEIEGLIFNRIHGCYETYAQKHWAVAHMEQLYTRSLKYHHVPPGGGYHQWHHENMNTDSDDRQMVFHIALNNTTDGEGSLEFLNWKGNYPPVAGSVLMWPASWTHVHRGNAMKTMHKHYITGWLTYSGKGKLRDIVKQKNIRHL